MSDHGFDASDLDDLLVGPDDPAVADSDLWSTPPEDLFDRCVLRLEAEGLIQPHATTPTPWLRHALAASLLLGLGAFGGRLSAPATSPTTASTPAPNSAPNSANVAAVATDAAAAIDLAHLTQSLETAQEGRLKAEQALESALRDLATRTREANAKTTEIAALRAESQRTAGRLQEVRQRLAITRTAAQEERAQREQLLQVTASVRQQLHRSVYDVTRGARALAQLEDLVDRLPRFEVVGAERVERWDPASAAWRPLGGADRLVPGDILTGASRASLETSAQRYRLAADLYVVTVEGRIEPLPDPDAPSLGPLPDEPSVETLIERFRSGSPQARADAQRALTQLWMTHGDPEPDLVTRVAEAAAGVERAAGLPSTAEAWETWWRRVQPVVARAGT